VTRLEVRRRALRHDLVRQPAPARRAGLTWPRLPAAAEVAITGAGYLGYALVRLAVQARPSRRVDARGRAVAGPNAGCTWTSSRP
jgi:hypothetical protein